MLILDDELDLTLVRVHVIEPVGIADRVGVCYRPGRFPGTGKRNVRRARGPLTSPASAPLAVTPASTAMEAATTNSRFTAVPSLVG